MYSPDIVFLLRKLQRMLLKQLFGDSFLVPED
jgi:hypothetical protein